jgi:methyl-accepting chemotaxis protein
VHAANKEPAALNHAQELVLQLDTRASELEVDGFKAIVREDPAARPEELADDIATPPRPCWPNSPPSP